MCSRVTVFYVAIGRGHASSSPAAAAAINVLELFWDQPYGLALKTGKFVRMRSLSLSFFS